MAVVEVVEKTPVDTKGQVEPILTGKVISLKLTNQHYARVIERADKIGLTPTGYTRQALDNQLDFLEDLKLLMGELREFMGTLAGRTAIPAPVQPAPEPLPAKPEIVKNQDVNLSAVINPT